MQEISYALKEKECLSWRLLANVRELTTLINIFDIQIVFIIQIIVIIVEVRLVLYL